MSDDYYVKQEKLRLKKDRDRIFTPSVVAVLSDPERAIAFRVYNEERESVGWIGAGKEAKLVSKVFADPENFADKHFCIFHPDAAFDFKKGNDTVRVTCCFSCTEIEVKLNNDITGYIGMEKVRDKVLALVKLFFGSDPYIKNIPDHSR